MFNTAFRILGQGETAEDIMHEAFLTAFKRLDQFNFEATFGSWLKRIVINLSLNQLKREKMIKEKEAGIDWQEEERGMENHEESERWSSQFHLSDIVKASEQLAKKHALVFNLYMIEGYDHEEIAEIMGISTSTSRSQLSRAKQNLKEILIKKLDQTDVRT